MSKKPAEKALKKKRSFKLSFQGSRSLTDERVKVIILEEIKKHDPTIVVTHAEPGGVCAMARQVCKEIAMPLELHFLNFRYLRGAFFNRTKELTASIDFCVFIHDGESVGCANEIKLAEKMNVPYSYHKLERAKYKESVGFAVETDWDKMDLDVEDLREAQI